MDESEKKKPKSTLPGSAGVDDAANSYFEAEMFREVNALSIPEEMPDRLYHYTDGGGLLGILNSKNVWASKADHLNDRMETKYPIEVIEEAIDAVLLVLPANKFRDALIGERSILAETARNYDVYVTCFCREGDLLSQWRGYGLHGTGYSLGFSSLWEHVPPEFQLSKVIYDRTEQIARSTAIVKSVNVAYERTIAAHPKVKTTPIATSAVYWTHAHLFFLSFLFKHPAWAEEKEWRIHSHFAKSDYSSELTLGFRAGRQGIVPYFALPLVNRFAGPFPLTGQIASPFPLASVTAGPGIQEESGREALELLKKSHKLNFEVFASKVPLR